MIRPPSINLARRPFRNNTVYYAVFGTCFAVLLTASVYNVYDFTSRGEDLARLEADLAERTKVYMALRDDVEKMKKDISGLNLKTLDSKSSFANGLILSRLFSWSTLFDRMEDLIPPDVKIRSIRPSISATGIEIQIDGLSKTAEAMYDFESNLTSSDFFMRVYPVSENTRESKTEINFDLTMDYIPAGKPGSQAASSPPSPVAGLPEAPPEGESGEQADADAAGADTAPARGGPGDEQAAPPDQTQVTASAAGQAAGPEQPPAGSVGTPAQPPQQAAAPPRAGQPVSQPVPQPAPAAAQPKPQAQQPPVRSMPSGPVPPLVGQGVVLGAEAAARPSKPLTQYTNKEFIDTYGETKFLRLRGDWLPRENDLDPKVTNDQYIQKYGLEKFLTDRGDLDRSKQIPGGRR